MLQIYFWNIYGRNVKHFHVWVYIVNIDNTVLKSYLPLFATFFRNMKSCQNLTRFDLGRLFAMHIAQKNSEVRHSILHVDLIPITRLVGYLVLRLEKSDSKI